MSRPRSLRAAAALALAAAVLPGPWRASPAVAQYPEACSAGAAGAGRRGLVASPESADAAVLAAVRRTGGAVGARTAAIGLREVTWASAAGRDRGLAVLRAVPGVRYAEPEIRLSATRSANDPRLKEQWGLAAVRAPRAWDAETGVGSDVTVAVLDTGVDFRHPDLAGRVLPGPNVAYGTEDSQDDHAHGTHVAGIVAAATDNRLGVAGMSWGARILAVKVLDKAGHGTSCDIAVGIVEAADAEVDVINMSLGAPYRCPLAFRAAVAYAEHKGVLVVASSGNDGYFASPQSAPANCAGVLGVGATDRQDRPTAFTTFGASVDVAAPGEAILSTYFDPKRNTRGYAAFSGTSMAAPFVSGLAALIVAQHPDWTPAQVAARIMSTTDDLGPPGRDDYFGTGRINAARALGR